MSTPQDSLSILKRGVVDLISENDLKDKLERKGQLRVKLGADPTRPDLHLGHAVILRKMRQFQDLGHKVIMLIGDFTAMIGDPSGKNKTRPPLSLEAARANAQSYLEQCKIILKDDPDVLEIRWNSEWLEKMGFKEVIQLTGKYTVARILERDDFSKRLSGGVSISMHEIMYPLAQAYDSVALEADVELGGTDQLFNLLVGRDIQREYGQEAQVVMTLPLLVGLDGVEKMSKSLDNYIGLTDAPEVMYAKLMKVPDTLLENYFVLLTERSSADIAGILVGHPVEAHRILAHDVLAWAHPNADVAAAEERYNIVAKGVIPEDLPEFEVPSSEFNAEGQVQIAKLAVLGGLASSNGDARRLIQGKGLKLNGETVEDPQMTVALEQPIVLQKGKDKFARLAREKVGA